MPSKGLLLRFKGIASRSRAAAVIGKRLGNITCALSSSSGRSDFEALFEDSAASPFGRGLNDFDRRMDDMFRESERMQDELERQLTQSRGAGRTYRRENRTEEKLKDGGSRKSYYSESITVYGPGGEGGAYESVGRLGPNFGSSSALFLPLAAWLAFGARFYSSFSRTTFKPEVKNRVMFSLLWPVLVLTSSKFRKEFWKALTNRQNDVDKS
ncbi:hypothetical protein HOP50_18g81740 [Chloropicon primus]|uniref:Uncharacterized protein n=2 Tax=Chloropicon primus TaxID=1764295 RepID=A0A5B8N0R8_9CHLO|nr:hypothetical protein A3770_18p81500 [Chloropicon primus]UPR04829.1 hypothetical protein HOP50_18g81740 [Chloropicon primus]|eukprot:QDZ25632.1 hypothetical protein A3770_18p81500 [Chloropicon primus]